MPPNDTLSEVYLCFLGAISKSPFCWSFCCLIILSSSLNARYPFWGGQGCWESMPQECLPAVWQAIVQESKCQKLYPHDHGHANLRYEASKFLTKPYAHLPSMAQQCRILIFSHILRHHCQVGYRYSTGKVNGRDLCLLGRPDQESISTSFSSALF